MLISYSNKFRFLKTFCRLMTPLNPSQKGCLGRSLPDLRVHKIKSKQSNTIIADHDFSLLSIFHRDQQIMMYSTESNQYESDSLSDSLDSSQNFHIGGRKGSQWAQKSASTKHAICRMDFAEMRGKNFDSFWNQNSGTGSQCHTWK